MRTLAASLAALFLLVPAASFAQAESEAAAPIEDRPALKLNEVERGVYFGTEAGAFMLFGPNGTSSGFSPGRSIGLSIGTDIGEALSVGLLALGTAVDTPAAFVGPTGNGGDFSSLTLGAFGKFNFYAKADENGVKRQFAYLRAGAGLSLMSKGPYRATDASTGAFDGSDILVLAGPGYEFFTHLRHFSVGIEADFVFGVNNMAAGLMLNPTLRYTF